MENNKDILSVWRALDTFTKGTNSRQKEIPHHFTADAFNDYFLSIAETTRHLMAISSTPAQNAMLISVSKRQRELTDSFTIPLMAVHVMGNYISGMNNKKFSGPDQNQQSVA